MKNINFFGVLVLISCLGCTPKNNQLSDGEQSRVIKKMIEAVNDKNAEKYVNNFAEDVQVYVDGKQKIIGKKVLQENRAKHFKRYPKVSSKIEYLLEIDNKVIMHDKVWLDDVEGEGQDIVEIFTFKNGQVYRVDVVQPDDLFEK
ncbi:nuclear transport factor 2 family protein [Aquimarina algiphila]|uniref:nuclear transport factor 2 family protein n=1 Tax=Aquimarina algiphila TaxID=2047982 RepID=UPI0024911F0E|nr:nuclear transport factor 2 family protein [Aquimarina algiphila]